MEDDDELSLGLGGGGSGSGAGPSSAAEPRILSVTDLTRSVRTLLESAIGDVWVEGEVSNLRRQASGHQYFTLKDEGAQLSCVLFRGHARFAPFPIREGMQVQVFGGITVYEARGQYQMVVRLVQGGGAGALQARFEALKRALQAEGLFDAAHKKPLPRFPAIVGIVTSPTGAAVRDILNILRRRAPWVRAIVAPVRVQGAGAEREIADAIALLDHAEEHGLPRPDVLIVGRGGGSIEDLWNFNEEIVARAIFACSIPVVSAVGHEIDFTIADFTADLRAPTPSAAAEIVVPDADELRRSLEQSRSAMTRRVRATLDHWCDVIRLTRTGTLEREPRRLLREWNQTVDSLAVDLDRSARDRIQSARERTFHASHGLAVRRPDRIVAERGSEIRLLAQRLSHLTRSHVRRAVDRHAHSLALLRSLGPDAVFARGFSMTLDSQGAIVTDAAQVRTGDEIRTRVAQGTITSRVERSDPPRE